MYYFMYMIKENKKRKFVKLQLIEYSPLSDPLFDEPLLMIFL